jgi:hypothetical protein
MLIVQVDDPKSFFNNETFPVDFNLGGPFVEKMYKGVRVSFLLPEIHGNNESVRRAIKLRLT